MILLCASACPARRHRTGPGASVPQERLRRVRAAVTWHEAGRAGFARLNTDTFHLRHRRRSSPHANAQLCWPGGTKHRAIVAAAAVPDRYVGVLYRSRARMNRLALVARERTSRPPAE